MFHLLLKFTLMIVVRGCQGITRTAATLFVAAGCVCALGILMILRCRVEDISKDNRVANTSQVVSETRVASVPTKNV